MISDRLSALRLHRGRQKLLPPVLRLVQPGPPPCRDRPDDPGPGALRPDRCRPRRPPAHARSRVPCQSGALRQQAPDPARQADRGLDQPANAEGPELNTDPGAIASCAAMRAASPRRSRKYQPTAALCSMPYGVAFTGFCDGTRCRPPLAAAEDFNQPRTARSDRHAETPIRAGHNQGGAVRSNPTLNAQPGCIKVVDTLRYCVGEHSDCLVGCGVRTRARNRRQNDVLYIAEAGLHTSSADTSRGRPHDGPHRTGRSFLQVDIRNSG